MGTDQHADHINSDDLKHCLLTAIEFFGEQNTTINFQNVLISTNHETIEDAALWYMRSYWGEDTEEISGLQTDDLDTNNRWEHSNGPAAAKIQDIQELTEDQYQNLSSDVATTEVMRADSSGGDR